MTRKHKNKDGSWGWLLERCLRDGKEKVLAELESIHRSMEWQGATAWEDPSTYPLARKLDATLLKQDVTMIRLRQMTDEDIRNSLEKEVFV